MIYGDQFAKKFGGADGSEPDWFLLTISGQDALGNDYRQQLTFIWRIIVPRKMRTIILSAIGRGLT